MAKPAKKQSSIFDVSAETRRKFSDAFGPGSLLTGALSAAGTAASGLASGRPIAPGVNPQQTPLTKQPEAAPVQGVDTPARAAMDRNELETAADREPEAPGGMGAGTAPVGSLGGYKARTLSLPEEIERASTQASGAIQAELEAGRQYAKQVTPLQAEESKRVQQRMAAEEGRMGRLVDLGKQQQTLTDEMGKRVESFRVDPNRIFGQGGERAATTFGIGIASALSNIGEAMQGKAATNQILSLVQNRIAQDIGLQENDYRRMLQGYEVKRNGLMDAIRQVGDERLGAEALAKQQGFFYADQLGKIAKQVGLTDAQAARPLLEAQARILQGLGEQKGRVEQFNVAAQNQAAQFNAQLEAQRRQLEEQRRIANLSRFGLSEYDQKRLGEQLDKANEKQLVQRSAGLREMKAMLQANPNVAEATKGVIQAFVNSVAGESQPGVIQSKLAQLAVENLSPQDQQFVRAYQRYIGGRLTALGGKAITSNEKALFNLANYTSPKQFGALLDEESNGVREDALSIWKSSNLRGDARDILARDLRGLYQGLVPEPTEKPPEVK